MKVAIASGKGGTGKTTVATNLAWLASQSGLATAYLDCDTEAPNGHLFLRPVIEQQWEVVRMIPQVDMARCTVCGQCGEICQFSAIVCLGQKVLIFPELCHSCGGCQWVCPTNAITEGARAVGVVETGHSGALRFVQGRLNVGEASSPPVIRAVKQAAPAADLLLYDAPPGTACPMIETVRGADFVLLVTEPTPFGLHDLRLAWQVVRSLKMNCGAVINRALVGATETRQFCLQARIPILAEIPDVMAIAEAYAEGKLAVEAVPGLRRMFAQLLLDLSAAVQTRAFPEAMRRTLHEIIHPPADPAGGNGQGASGQSAPVCYLALRKRALKSTPAPAIPSPDS
jgi:MinD superfamily P-loop ATPase